MLSRMAELAGCEVVTVTVLVALGVPVVAARG